MARDPLQPGSKKGRRRQFLPEFEKRENTEKRTERESGKLSGVAEISEKLAEAWWSAKMEGAVSERPKAYRSDEDRQAYISASRRASSVIAKAQAWQSTCSSLSPKSNTLPSRHNCLWW